MAQFPSIEKDYTIGNLMGQGSFGKIYKIRSKQFDSVLALKIIDLQEMNEMKKSYMFNEVEILKQLSHDNVIRFYGSRSENNHLLILMEYCQIDLFDVQEKYFNGNLPEHLVIHILRTLTNVVGYIHRQNILHRDLKTDNIMLQMSEKEYIDLQNGINVEAIIRNATLKLIDFGTSIKLESKTSRTSTVIGSGYMMAPEIVRNEAYSFQADVYSLGVIAYVLLMGDYPQQDQQVGNQVQQPLRELIQQMLNSDPEQRITMIGVNDHQIIRDPNNLQQSVNKQFYQSHLYKSKINKDIQHNDDIQHNNNNQFNDNIPYNNDIPYKNDIQYINDIQYNDVIKNNNKDKIFQQNLQQQQLNKVNTEDDSQFNNDSIIDNKLLFRIQKGEAIYKQLIKIKQQYDSIFHCYIQLLGKDIFREKLLLKLFSVGKGLQIKLKQMVQENGEILFELGKFPDFYMQVVHDEDHFRGTESGSILDEQEYKSQIIKILLDHLNYEETIKKNKPILLEIKIGKIMVYKASRIYEDLYIYDDQFLEYLENNENCIDQRIQIADDMIEQLNLKN